MTSAIAIASAGFGDGEKAFEAAGPEYAGQRRRHAAENQNPTGVANFLAHVDEQAEHGAAQVFGARKIDNPATAFH